jgi:tetratricopeptide (TPR) repeat protein
MIVAIIFLFIFSQARVIVFADPGEAKLALLMSEERALLTPVMEYVEILFQANQSYEHGDYNKAIEQYSQLLNQNIASNAIHFNLGNAYFRGNQLGPAIFHFRKAFYLSPRDPDIKYNLAFAREKVADQIKRVPPFWQNLFSFLDFFTEKEGYRFVLLWGCITLAFGILHLYVKKNGTKWAKNTSMGIFISTLFLLFGREMTLEKFGVVAAPEISVYSGFERDSVVLFKIHEGVELHLSDSAGETWVQIRLADGKKGWTRAEGILF